MRQRDDVEKRAPRVFKVSKQIAAVSIGLLFLLLITRCKNDSGNDPVVDPDLGVKIIGHKGGGSSPFNSLHIENTLPSVQDGLQQLDGVEVDVQMSLDGTLWLFHDNDIADTGCDANLHGTIPLLKDSEIQNLLICDGTKLSRIYKLEEIINYWNADPVGFYISMHIKLDFSSETINDTRIGGEASYLSKMAVGLAKVFATYNHQNQVFIEVYDATFCAKIHAAIPNIKVCLLKEVSFQQQIRDAVNLGYDGISCIFTEPTITADEVKRAQDSGLIIQLWTPDTEVELKTAYELKPNFIQTNNLNAINILKAKIIF